MIKLLNRLLGREGRGTSAGINPQETPAIIRDASSDGQAHVNQQHFSVVIDDLEYEWDIAPLHTMAEAGHFKLVRFNIPDKFRTQWFWGDTTLDEHVKRTLCADFNYPIIIWDGQVVDGAHRCCLALAAGINTIKAYNIQSMPPHDRAYIPKLNQRTPLHPKLTHQDVIDKTHLYMFTPLPKIPTP